MGKFLKTTFLVCILAVLVLGLGLGAIVTFVSPNKFKPIITAQVLKYTGRKLVIDGDLSWSFYPYLGFKAGHTVLDNASGFNPKVFAEINSLTVGIKLMPLLHAKIESDAVTLNGLTLNLIRNADGTTNWQDLAALGAGATNVRETTNATQTRKSFSIDVPAVDISDAQINWHDAQNKQTATLSKFELHVKNISQNAAFPVQSSFDFSSQNPTISGQGSIAGQLKMNLDKQIYAFDGLTVTIKTSLMNATINGDVLANMAEHVISIQHFISNLTNFKSIKQAITLQGDITANVTDKTAHVSNFVGKVANLNVSGDVNIANYQTASGRLQTQPFDVKAFLQAIGQDNSSLQVAKMLTADFTFSAAAPNLQAVTLQGKAKLDSLQAANLKASNVAMQVQLKNGVLAFTPITASLYQGSLSANTTINLMPAAPQISAQIQLANIQAEPLLQDLEKQSNKFKVKGAGNIDLQITTAGVNQAAFMNNLNGSGKFNFKDGQLTGVNIGNMIDSAAAILKQQATPSNNDDVTNFGNLTGTLAIKSGVVTNNDLLLNSPRFTTKGQGTINLASQQINYLLLTTPANLTSSHTNVLPIDLTNLTIPVRITGTLSNPVVRLDTQAIMQAVAKQQVQKVTDKFQDKVRDQIKAKVPGQAGQLLQNLLGK